MSQIPEDEDPKDPGAKWWGYTGPQIGERNALPVIFQLLTLYIFLVCTAVLLLPTTLLPFVIAVAVVVAALLFFLIRMLSRFLTAKQRSKLRQLWYLLTAHKR